MPSKWRRFEVLIPLQWNDGQEIPEELLDKAQKASGSGITQTVRTGLQLVAASHAYARLRQLRGKVRFAHTATELKADR